MTVVAKATGSLTVVTANRVSARLSLLYIILDEVLVLFNLVFCDTHFE